MCYSRWCCCGSTLQEAVTCREWGTSGWLAARSETVSAFACTPSLWQWCNNLRGSRAVLVPCPAVPCCEGRKNTGSAVAVFSKNRSSHAVECEGQIRGPIESSAFEVCFPERSLFLINLNNRRFSLNRRYRLKFPPPRRGIHRECAIRHRGCILKRSFTRQERAAEWWISSIDAPSWPSGTDDFKHARFE